MAELQLKSWRFRQEREADWRKLEALLARLEAGGVRTLRDDELLQIPVLYRAALSSLSVARATSLDHSLVDYLESLCTRAYFFVYGARTSLLQRAARFFTTDWPRAAQGLWRETLVSLGLTVLGTIAAYVLTMKDPDWYYSFIPEGLAGGRDPSATAASLKAALYDGGLKDGLSFFATFLFTHNAQVALFAFALGFAFCLPTVFLLITNGFSLGALFAVYSQKGLAFELGGWIFIHGVTELWAVILAGAAGLRIGWTVAFPGELTRVEAAGRAGRQAAALMCGVVVMLFCAGLLEGFARQLIKADLARYAVAAGTAVLWALYLYGPRPGARHGAA